MAYLSDSDDEEQKKQSESPGFNAFGGSPSQDQSRDTGNQFNAWMGSQGSSTQAPAKTSDTKSEESAGSFQAPSGDSGSGSTKSPQPSSFSAPSQSGLSGSGQGTGFINFQNYESNAPSQAANISAAGQKVIGGEGANLTAAENPAKKIISDAASDQGPGEGDSSVEGLLNSGSDDAIKKIQGWITPTAAGDTIAYKPTDDYATNGGNLGTGSGALDYLAKDQIAQGGYTQGERMLDNALVSGDAGAQQALASNAQMNTDLQGRISTELPQLQTQIQAANTAAGDRSAAVNQSIADAGTKLQSDIDATTAAANTNPTPETIAAENAAIKAYSDWYAQGGQVGGIWDGDVTKQGQVASTVTPDQAKRADSIWKVQHPGDTDPSHMPYPDPDHASSGTPKAESITGHGSAGAPAVTSGGQVDPGDPGSGDSTYEKYIHSINAGGSSKEGGYPGDPNLWNLTPSEKASYVATHPDKAGLFPNLTPADYSAAAYQIQSILNANPPIAPPYWINVLNKGLAAIKSKMGGSTGNKTPYEYGKSIGMTDQQLAGMGIKPTSSGIPAPVVSRPDTKQLPPVSYKGVPSWKNVNKDPEGY